MFIAFNPRDKKYKSIFGAVRQNESVVFRVAVPCDMGISGVCMLIRDDKEQIESAFRNYFAFEKTEDNLSWWKLDYSASQTGLLMYHFECYRENETIKITRNSQGFGEFANNYSEFQLTIYSEKFSTPDFFKGGIMYQIFPDRFYFSGEEKNCPKDRIIRNDWNGEPFWEPDENGRVKNNDYFGGDLKGIEKKLDYLESLGVNLVYLNPIFEANSNHRYDTADYSKIDCLLGDENDFERMCSEAEKRGIGFILDGVFSHTGADSVYFNKFHRYDSTGAYESQASPYFEWYNFEHYPDKYKSWWGFDILPEVDENNESYIDFITGKDGIVGKWLKKGARGYRLDVADELPDKFLDALRKSVKSEKKDSIILGEVWEDASNKESYGERRRYLQGNQLDSVMNYPFRDAILGFVRTGKAEGFFEKIVSVLENYPKPVVDVLMNHIGTHDTERAITFLAGESCENKDRLWQSLKKLTKEEYERGITLLKIASVIQFTLPGVPCIYYGDEVGMEGYKDPFNRKCFPWGNENEEISEHYRSLGKFRRANEVFFDGEFEAVSESDGVLAYKRKCKTEVIFIIINRNAEGITYYTDFSFDEIFGLGKKTSGGVMVDKFGFCALVKRKDTKNE